MGNFLSDLQQYGLYFLFGLIAFIFIQGLYRLSILYLHSNWNHLIDEFNFSTEEFYKRLRQELKSNGIKNVDIHSVSLNEGNYFSLRRRYLRVEWKEYRYDMCAAPFGKGFFISWWLLYKNPIMKIVITVIPFAGPWLAEKWYPVTYYKVDTASMFMTYCHSSVLKVIEDITQESGARSLTENERKPILKDVFKR